jgi:hypothetical protein
MENDLKPMIPNNENKVFYIDKSSNRPLIWTRYERLAPVNLIKNTLNPKNP